MADNQTFAQNVQNALAKKDKRGTVFHAGMPHPIFVQKGMPGQPIRISPAVIRKAKKSKYNNHSVADEHLERLPELLNNPVALLRSLTVPNSFVTVLDTQDDHGWPVIASIKPENGYNEVTSIYGRENFDVFIKRTNEAGAVLSVNKKKATEEVWASIQSRGETTVDDYQILLSPKYENTSIPHVQKDQDMANQPARGLHRVKENNMADHEWTGISGNWSYDEEIAHAFENQTFQFRTGEGWDFEKGEKFPLLTVMEMKNGEPDFSTAQELRCDSLAAAKEFVQKTIEQFENTNNVSLSKITDYVSGIASSVELKKEAAIEQPGIELPEEPEQIQAERTPEEIAFANTLHQRKVVADALKAGTLSCLPGADGFADTAPAVNPANGARYHGANLLYLKEHQKQNEFPTAEYATAEQIAKSGVAIRQGQKGVTVSFSEKNDETGQWEQRNVRLFNTAQTAKPWEFKKWAEQQIQTKEQDRQDFLKSQYGDNYKPPEQKEKTPGPDIVCSSTDPVKYLGQYLAAVSMGGRFKASPEQAAEFSTKMDTSLFQPMENSYPNPFKLSKICNEAGGYCKEVIKELRNEQARQQAIERKPPEQHRSRGMGR